MDRRTRVYCLLIGAQFGVAVGQSLSEWVGLRIRAGLPAEVRRQLAARPGVGRPKSAAPPSES